MNIFVVVGTVFPFDRLIETMDSWAKEHPEHTIIAQIGKGTYIPQSMASKKYINAKEFNEYYENADLIVSHAGMGVILKALMANKPIVILPRKLELNEHNTDHQIATAKALDNLKYVNVAWSSEELVANLNKPEGIKSKKTISSYAPEQLTSKIKDFIQGV